LDELFEVLFVHGLIGGILKRVFVRHNYEMAGAARVEDKTVPQASAEAGGLLTIGRIEVAGVALESIVDRDLSDPHMSAADLRRFAANLHLGMDLCATAVQRAENGSLMPDDCTLKVAKTVVGRPEKPTPESVRTEASGKELGVHDIFRASRNALALALAALPASAGEARRHLEESAAMVLRLA